MARALSIDINVHPGGHVFQRAFTRYVSDLADLTPLWGDLADLLRHQTDHNFDTEGAASGPRWRPLSKAYARWKAARFPGKPILQRSGKLRDSLVRESWGHVYEARERAMVWGTSVPYAGFHQSGTRHMPSRPIIRLTEGNQDDMTKVVHAFLLRTAKGLDPGMRT